MKILHTSDWHLGISINNVSMLPEQEHFINQLTDIVKTEEIGAVVISGDIFDSSVSSGDAIALYNKAMTAVCCDLKVPVFIIAGNHDGAARLASCRELLKNSGLYITGKLTKNIAPVNIENAAFYCIPYFNIEEARYIFPKKEIKSYEDALRIICGKIKSEMDPLKSNIILSHTYIKGYTLSESDKSAVLGTANIVSKDVFKGFSYAALGHLHKYHKISANTFYSGSPVKYSFSEADGNKYVVVFDTNDSSIKNIPLTPIHDMRIIKGTYDELMNSIKDCDDYIKVEITDRYVGMDTLEVFKSYYPNHITIRGKSCAAADEFITLTPDEIQSLNPQEILVKFFCETYSCEPQKNQLELFNAALSDIERGDELS